MSSGRNGSLFRYFGFHMVRTLALEDATLQAASIISNLTFPPLIPQSRLLALFCDGGTEGKVTIPKIPLFNPLLPSCVRDLVKGQRENKIEKLGFPSLHPLSLIVFLRRWQ